MMEPTKPSWSASFAQARSAQQTLVPATDQPRGLVRQDFTCGNNNSDAFFEKIAASHAESQRLRLQCRAAAASSPARNPEERVNLDHIQRSLDTARAVGSYSRTFGDHQLGHPDMVPAHLGHLLVPMPTVTAEDTSRELTLPGAIEPLPLDCAIAGGDVAPEATSAAPRDPPQRVAFTPDDAEIDNFGGSEGFEEEEAHQEAIAKHGPPPVLVLSGSAGGYGSNTAPGLLGARPTGGLSGKSAPSVHSVKSAPSGNSSDDDDPEGTWPPKPPLMRFKGRMQFSAPFRPKESAHHKSLLRSFTRMATEKLSTEENTSTELKDMTVGWINKVFEMDICNVFQFEVSFPVIILTMLDAIYTRRVNWREVDFRYQYQRALQKNFAVLEKIWQEVNMEKAREFRVESTPLRMENMFAASVQDKLELCRLMKRWYDVRRHHADPYDAMARRRDIVSQSKTWGVPVKFPPWILFDKEEPQTRPETTITDTWRVRSKEPINVVVNKGGDFQVIGMKAPFETFDGYQDGDWVGLIGEPGFVRRVKLDTREKFVDKRDKFRVVARAPVPVCASPTKGAQKIGEKKYGDFVLGYADGEWVELAGEDGYMSILSAGTAERVLQVCSLEDYRKMPEYKRLIWFLGSPEHQTL